MAKEVPDLGKTIAGDGPCGDCGTSENVVWFTDNVFWNAIVRSQPDYVEPILCIPCFVRRTEALGYRPTGWRVHPEFHWQNVRDRPGVDDRLPVYVRDQESGAQVGDQ